MKKFRALFNKIMMVNGDEYFALQNAFDNINMLH